MLVPVILRVMVAVDPSYESPKPDSKVIVIVDEKEPPGPKEAGKGPLAAENPVPDGTTATPSDVRLAGELPVFSTVYEITTLFPGEKGPTLKVALLVGSGDVSVKTA